MRHTIKKIIEKGLALLESDKPDILKSSSKLVKKVEYQLRKSEGSVEELAAFDNLKEAIANFSSPA